MPHLFHLFQINEDELQNKILNELMKESKNRYSTCVDVLWVHVEVIIFSAAPNSDTSVLCQNCLRYG